MSDGSSPAEPPGPAAPDPARGDGPRPGPHGPRAPASAPRDPGRPGSGPRFLRRRRAEALALALPLAALFMLMPPFVRIFAHDGRILGAPSVLVFLLALWLALIFGTRALARRLTRRDAEP